MESLEVRTRGPSLPAGDGTLQSKGFSGDQGGRMIKRQCFSTMLLTVTLLCLLVSTVWAFPPLPSSFYGEIHITDDPPGEGDTLEAYVPDVAGAVGSATVVTYLTELVYAIDVHGDDSDIEGKDGGIEGDTITFEINGRVVATAIWHQGTNVQVDFHPPDAAATNTGPIDEGASATIDASTSQDWGGDISTYEFDCDNDATYEIGPQGGATAPCAFDDNGDYTVGVRVIDLQGGVSVDSTVVVVANVAPTATFNAPSAVDEGDDIALSLTAPDDPSPDDVAAGFSYAFDCGSGYGDWSASSTTTCPTTDDGSVTVWGKIRDKDLGETEYSATVTVDDVIPSDVDAGGPYAGTAGQPVSLSGSATCASVDICTYAWDLDDDGEYDDASGASPSYTWLVSGTYTIHMQVTDDDGNSVDAPAEVGINAATHSVGLLVGWNLVSFNLQPVDTAVASVLSSVDGSYDLVYAWDAPTQQWLKYDDVPMSPDTLEDLDEKMGFWIHMTTADTLEVAGDVPTTTDINLDSAGMGWNLVGYPSAVSRDLPGVLQDHGVGEDFSVVYAYHADDSADPWKLFDRTAPAWANDLTDLSPGWGFWVQVDADHTWDVAYPAP